MKGIHWKKEWHKYFPDSFKRFTLDLLLISKRKNKEKIFIPKFLIFHILCLSVEMMISIYSSKEKIRSVSLNYSPSSPNYSPSSPPDYKFSPPNYKFSSPNFPRHLHYSVFSVVNELPENNLNEKSFMQPLLEENLEGADQNQSKEENLNERKRKSDDLLEDPNENQPINKK